MPNLSRCAGTEHTGSMSTARKVSVPLATAIFLVDINMAHIFWSWVWFLSYPAGLALMIFQKWWGGLIFLIVVPGTIFAAVKKSALDFVIEHAVEDAAFYNFVIANGITVE